MAVARKMGISDWPTMPILDETNFDRLQFPELNGLGETIKQVDVIFAPSEQWMLYEQEIPKTEIIWYIKK
ncbi:hypothetical protein GCM10027592_23890 [Spirosoma flavus]